MRKKRERTFAEKAYTTTQLDCGYTQDQIVKMLQEIGITKIRINREGEDYSLEFLAQVRRGEAPRHVKINVPYTPELDDTVKQKQQKKNVLFRVLFYHLKDKFVAIDRGLKEFEQEFLSDLMVESDGVKVRLGDLIVPKYKEMLKEGQVAVFRIKGKNNEGDNN